MFKIAKLILLLFFFYFPLLVFASNKVEFKGLVRVSEASVSAIVKDINSAASGPQVNKVLKDLYKTGWFADIQVEQKKADVKNKRLVFTFVEQNKIGKITYKGFKKIKPDDFINGKKDDEAVNSPLKFNLREGDMYLPHRLGEAVQYITQQYHAKGYLNARIESRVLPFDDGEVEIELKVSEGKVVKIRRVNFVGNKNFSDKKLRKVIKTKEKNWLSFLTSAGKLDEQALATDKDYLKGFYLDQGYLTVQVGEPHVELAKNRERLSVSIPLTEGLRYKVVQVTVAGDILTTPQELESLLMLKAGDWYKKSLEMQDVEILRAHYGNQAYAYADVIPQFELDESKQTVKVIYHLTRGPKVRLGKIIIKGNAITLDKVIRRELRVVENSYYNAKDIQTSRQRLMQLGYFESVDFSIPRGDSENTVDLVIQVVEKNTGNIQVGGGFSTLESFVFTASLQKENFLGRGVSGSLATQLSSKQQNVLLSYADNYFLDSHWYFGLTFKRLNSQLNTDFNRKSFGGSVTVGREVFDYFHTRTGYNIEDIEVNGFSLRVPQFLQDNASGLTSSLSQSFIYDRRDSKLFARKGYYLSNTTEWSDEFLGADTTFTRHRGEAKFYWPVVKKLVFKGRGQIDYTHALGDNPIPLGERYFLGGFNSLRGYNFNSIGPTLRIPAALGGDADTVSYGGTKQLLFNAEMELPIYAEGGFFTVVFFDAGQAFAEEQDYSLSSLRMDYGFGLRWISPLGPLRFEWGFPINKQSGESSTVFNFAFGETF